MLEEPWSIAALHSLSTASSPPIARICNNGLIALEIISAENKKGHAKPLMYLIAVEKRAWVFPQVRHRAPDRQPARGVLHAATMQKRPPWCSYWPTSDGTRHGHRICRLIPALHEHLAFDETFCPLQVGYASAIDKSIERANVVGEPKANHSDILRNPSYGG